MASMATQHRRDSWTLRLCAACLVATGAFAATSARAQDAPTPSAIPPRDAASGDTAGPEQDELASRDREARALFEASRTAYEAGRYEDALDYLRRAHAYSGRPELLVNIAQAADRLRRDREALEAYRAFVTARPDHPQALLARERIRFLETALERDGSIATPSDDTHLATTPSAPALVPTAHELDDRGDDEAPILQQWWFWTLVGVGLVGGGAGIALGVALSGTDEIAGGTVGGVVLTLRMQGMGP